MASTKIPVVASNSANAKRIAAIDWMRGFVMLLMVVDHVSMAYNANHLSADSAALYQAGKPLPDFAFFVRWLSHICAPTFVFLAGTALAISVERKVAKGVAAREIDRDILYRGAFIALLDPTIISLFSGRLTFQVLFAIGISMMCMAPLRRLSSSWLLAIALSWLVFGGWLTSWLWPPGQDAQSLVAGLIASIYVAPGIAIKYPVMPWLAMMILGWVFGRYLLDFRQGRTRIGPVSLLLGCAVLALACFALVRYANDYGNLWLYRYDNSWSQWLHVSKYPPSLSFTSLELGLMSLLLAMMILVERAIGVRDKGVLLVFGQTAMFFYLVHRLLLEGSATWLGWRGFGDLSMTLWLSLVMLVLLYPVCLWYRGYKARHPNSLWLRYL